MATATTTSFALPKWLVESKKQTSKCKVRTRSFSVNAVPLLHVFTQQLGLWVSYGTFTTSTTTTYRVPVPNVYNLNWVLVLDLVLDTGRCKHRHCLGLSVKISQVDVINVPSKPRPSNSSVVAVWMA